MENAESLTLWRLGSLTLLKQSVLCFLTMQRYIYTYTYAMSVFLSLDKVQHGEDSLTFNLASSSHFLRSSHVASSKFTKLSSSSSTHYLYPLSSQVYQCSQFQLKYHFLQMAI
jgi:hypothetical protein